jgi:hypothetical protein
VLAGLTQDQRHAVGNDEPALLVVARPGTEETHTIVRRVAHLIRARYDRAGEFAARLDVPKSHRAARCAPREGG